MLIHMMSRIAEDLERETCVCIMYEALARHPEADAMPLKLTLTTFNVV